MNKTLIEHRMSANLEIKSVAEKCGLSAAQIMAIEKNNMKAFSSKLVYQMSEKKLLKFYDRERVQKKANLDSIPLFLRS
jgi:transcriptional regulator with XRE-family HTH domain